MKKKAKILNIMDAYLLSNPLFFKMTILKTIFERWQHNYFILHKDWLFY